MSPCKRVFIGKFIDEGKSRDDITRVSESFYVDLDGDFLVSGSRGLGKTVLSKIVVEDCVMNGVPTIVIDPKGDLAQLTHPFSAGCIFGLTDEEANKAQEEFAKFDLLSLVDRYHDSIVPELHDHTFPPTVDYIKRVYYKKQNSKTPLVVVRLLSGSYKVNQSAVENWLEAILGALDELGNIENEKLLVIDEAHRYASSKSSQAYNLLQTLLRENRQAKLCVLLATQQEKDIGELIECFKYSFPFVAKGVCMPTIRATLGSTPAYVDYRRKLGTRWLLSVHKEKPMTSEVYSRTREYWDLQNHRMFELSELQLIARGLDLDDVDVRILNFLNSHRVLLDFEGAESALDEVGVKLDLVTNILRNKEFENLGHFHALLDYEKLGFPILAFFICKGYQPRTSRYRLGIQEILDSYNTVELFGIDSPSYVDVDLMAKFRFKDMHQYFRTIASGLLQISRRGKSETERFKKYVEEFIENCREKGIYALKSLPQKIPDDLLPRIPYEQLVSGCIFTKTFVEHPTCYIEDKVFGTLSRDEHETLRLLAEITYPEKPVYFDYSDLFTRMKETNLVDHDFSQTALEDRVGKMIESGLIKGAYVELPWEDRFGYNTSFLIGQLDLQRISSLTKGDWNHHYIQEVHTIVGTYDVLVKVRYRSRSELGSVTSFIHNFVNTENSVLLDVTKNHKTGYNLKRRF